MINWDKLAEPFPPDEIKHRPGAATWAHRDSCAGKQCRETRDESKHLQFSYIDARAVAERLDAIVTPAGWQFTCSVIPGSDIVKGRLEITVEGGTVVREDHGYPNSDRDDEPIKAATSDALKRCAVLFGIGRHLYEDNKPSTNGNGRAASPSARPPAASRPARDDLEVPRHLQGPQEPDWLAGEVPAPATVLHDQPPGDIRAGHYGPTCPQHVGRVWHDKYQKCTAKDPDTKSGYCEWRPSKRWVAEHELEGARA
jgi:hypothetical protein